MTQFYDARPAMICRAFLFPPESMKPYVAIRGNCLVLIVLLLGASVQRWRGLAGSQGRPKKADIYNIYGGKILSLSVIRCNPLMLGSGHARV